MKHTTISNLVGPLVELDDIFSALQTLAKIGDCSDEEKKYLSSELINQTEQKLSRIMDKSLDYELDEIALVGYGIDLQRYAGPMREDVVVPYPDVYGLLTDASNEFGRYFIISMKNSRS